MHPRHQRVLVAAALLVAACSGPAAPEPGPEENHPAVQTARRLVVESLQEEQGRPPAAPPRLLRLEAVEFRDASLGCPQPGMAYAQVITPGYRVWLDANGRRFDVRVAGDGGRICDDPPAFPQRRSQ